MAARRKKLGEVIGLSLGLLGNPACGDETTEPAPSVEEAAELVPLPPAPDPALLTRLRAASVHHDAIWRPVLWTWTTADQVELLRNDPVLLIRSESPERGPAWFDQVIAARAADEASPDPVAALLREPGLAARRFAWPNPWATLSGWEGESYGDRLIRVELRPDAIVARFDPSAADPWIFIERSGARVAAADVRADPSRLAAVYHVSTAPGRNPYREYVLVNESMISRWSIAPTDVRAEVDRALALLTPVKERLGAVPLELPADAAWTERVVTGAWPETPTDHASVATLWEGAIAFPNPAHRPEADAVGRLIEAMRAVPIPQQEIAGTPERRFRLRPPRPRLRAARMRPGPPAPFGTFIRGTF